MDSKLVVALAFAVFLAGCTGGSGNPRKGEETKSVGDALHINGPSCSTAAGSCDSIDQYVNPRIELSIKNNGSRSVGIVVKNPLSGDDLEPEAETFNKLSMNILRSRCPQIFNMKKSSLTVRKTTTQARSVYRKPKGSRDRVFEEGGSASGFGFDDDVLTLKPGMELHFTWVMRYESPEKLPERATCNLHFGINTTQQISAFKEVQIRKSRNVDVVDIQTRSSPGAMAIKIDAPDSWVAGREFPVSVTMENKKSGSPYKIRYFKGENPSSGRFRLSTYQNVGGNQVGIRCGKIRSGPIAFREGKTVSQQTECTGKLPPGSSSQVYQLFLKARYNYFFDLGSIKMEVEKEG
ncbi:MAG: hypothetical protein SVU32_04050 [Candidatus Nanohaloarchaea archaeon]|nr:hypothetical protein [Candidatus Nanohaloarchaea archaeon]